MLKFLDILSGLLKNQSIKNIMIGLIIAVIGGLILAYLVTFLPFPSPPPLPVSLLSIEHYPFPTPNNRSDGTDKALKWKYKLDCYPHSKHKYSLCWATLQLKLDEESDISDYKGISFLIKAEKTIDTTSNDTPTLEFNLHTEKDKYWYWTGKNNPNMNISCEWSEKRVLFSDLKPVYWKNIETAPSEPDLSKVYMLSLAAPTNSQRSNIIWIYETKLICENGSEISVNNVASPLASPLKTLSPLKGHWDATKGFKPIGDIKP